MNEPLKKLAELIANESMLCFDSCPFRMVKNALVIIAKIGVHGSIGQWNKQGKT